METDICITKDCQKPVLKGCKKRGLCSSHYWKYYYSIPANKKKHSERSINWIRFNKFGITRKDYDLMVLKQNGVCAICKLPPKYQGLDIDHDHTTGKIRELLCNHCNTMIGLAKESPELLRVAINYLITHKAVAEMVKDE